MKKILITAVVCLAVGLLVSAPVAAKTVVTKIEDEPGLILNDCTGCLIDITLSGVAVSSNVVNDNRVHSAYKQSLKIEGVDQCTGITYSGKLNYNSTANFSLDTPQFVQIFIERFALKSDAGDEIIIKVKSKITVNNNGDVTVNVYDYEFECTP
jgi:hypothetical protein